MKLRFVTGRIEAPLWRPPNQGDPIMSNDTTQTKQLDPRKLAQFTGTEHWYRHGLVRTVAFTDGVKYVADQAGAYWLVDIVAIAQRHTPAIAAEQFQLWQLAVHDNHSATVTCEDGNGKEAYRQEIAWTDFPPGGIKFYCCHDETSDYIRRVILLPSEY